MGGVGSLFRLVPRGEVIRMRGHRQLNVAQARARAVGMLLIVASAPLEGQAAGGVDGSAVDAVFSAYNRSDAPGCAVGVIRDGALAFGRGYGMANLEHGIAISPHTVFRTGSVGKQFTAAAIAIAARDGYIALDDPMRRWIPELAVHGDEPTIRQVVHHTSGLRDYLTLMWLRGVRDDDYYTVPEVRALIARQEELNFAPGSTYLYSNSGYFLLGEVLREATGRSLREYAEEVIFAPLGMTHSHFHDDHNHIVPNRAAGYAPMETGFRVSQTTLDMVGDGGVFTSIEDLVPWVDALNRDSLRPGLNRELEGTQRLTGGEDNPYAFGQRLGTYRGARTVSHGGSFVGFRAAIVRFPGLGTGIVTLCNRADADPSDLSMRVADVVLAEELEPAPTEEAGEGAGAQNAGQPVKFITEGAPFVGTFYSSELDVSYVLGADAEDGRLKLRFGPEFEAVLEELGPDRFQAAGIQLRMVREDGRVVGFDVDAGRVQNVRFTRR